MMRFLVIALVCSAVLSVLTPASFGQTPPPVAQQPTWAVGDTWTYAGADGVPFTLTVRGVTPRQYSVESKTGANVRVVQVDLNLSLNAFSTFEWPLQLQKRWSSNSRAPRGITGTETDDYTTTSTVDAFGPVTVPAGTFPAFQIKGRQCNITKKSCGDFVIWYAAQAKTYVKISWASAGYWGGLLSGKSTELVSYKVR
ncbi:MAG TPA: hypothetical protein VKV57_07040 [bacterium]|nr:hypothetical protein [bacterium]